MGDDQPVAGSSPSADSSSRIRSGSILSSIFRHSPSYSGENRVSEVAPERRARAYSESNLDDFDVKDGNGMTMPIRERTFTCQDKDSGQCEDIRKRSNCLTLSALLLGPRHSDTNNPTSSLTTFSTTDTAIVDGQDIKLNNDSGVFERGSESMTTVEDNNPTNQISNLPKVDEVTQNDHLNKKLLNSFLTKINTIAANIIDPTGSSEVNTQLYTDDVMMDRILRRVENKKLE